MNAQIAKSKAQLVVSKSIYSIEHTNTSYVAIVLALLITSINLDAANVLKAREILFVTLVAISIASIDFKKLAPLLFVCIIYLASFTYNLIIPGSLLDAFDGAKYILGLLYLYLLAFSSEKYLKTIVGAYLFTAVIVALLLVLLWLGCYFFDEFKSALILFSDTFESEKVAFLFMVRERKILDWWLPSVYYGTAPCIIPALGYCLAKRISNKSILWGVLSILLFFALVSTGARANIVSAIGLWLFYLGISIHAKKNRVLGIVFFTTAALAIIALMLAFLGDKGEHSLEVKTLHALSYQKLFNTDYMRAIFIGWGGGSYFYTEGFNEYVNITELSILETIRRYGLVFSIYIFLIWLWPLKSIFKRHTSSETELLIISLLFYIFVASTNPFLLGSIGFSALLFFTVTIGWAFPFKQRIVIRTSSVFARGKAIGL